MAGGAGAAAGDAGAPDRHAALGRHPGPAPANASGCPCSPPASGSPPRSSAPRSALLPAELQFLIADRGTHFTAQPFAAFAEEEDFVHVLIARHRPESNGIAERFVRTLKAWLAERAWDGVEGLEPLLAQFAAEYNGRPHQGLGLPGLSPNEFAARFWLL